MPTLQEFIDDCVAQVAARRAAEDAERQRVEGEFQTLLQSVVASVRQRLAAAIPQPLRQFTSYAGRRPELAQLQGYPAIWTPAEFKVDAPGLRLIRFTTSASDSEGPIVVAKIKIDDADFGTDWIEAVAAAKV
jgi:hypothetical protein